jgi:xanthosine utilization system XapX-like protein
MFDYRLALMAGTDIPIPELQLVIHQPTIKEIALIGDIDFFVGVQCLNVNKNMINIEDETLLTDRNNF